MDKETIEREIERVELLTTKNSTLIDVTGALARGCWEIALQLAKMNEGRTDAADAGNER